MISLNWPTASVIVGVIVALAGLVVKLFGGTGVKKKCTEKFTLIDQVDRKVAVLEENISTIKEDVREIKDDTKTLTRMLLKGKV